MKKIISLAICLICVFTLCVSAFAEEDQGSEFQQQVLALAQKLSPAEMLPQVMELVVNKVLEEASNITPENLESFDPAAIMVSSFEEASDFLTRRGMNEHAMELYAAAISAKYGEEISEGNTAEIAKDPLYGKFLACLESAVSLAADDPEKAADYYVLFVDLNRMFMDDGEFGAENYYEKAVKLLTEAAEKALDNGDWKNASDLYAKAADMYENYLLDNKAAEECRAKADKIRKENDPKYASRTGSVLSEGSLTVIVGVAAAVIFGLGGFFLGRKKKSTLTGED